MKTKSSKSLKTNKQRSIFRPLTLVFKKPTWRAKSFTVEINPYSSYVVTLRTFRTNPNTRAKSKVQKIHHVNLFGIKEIAVWHKTSKRNKKAQIRQRHFRKSMAYGTVFAGVFGVAIFGFQIADLVTRTPPAVVAQSVHSNVAAEVKSVVKDMVMPYSEPNRLIIDNIGVDTVVHNVGQLADGTIETPDVFSNQVGWYTNSPTPGEVGPAILLGHVDSYHGPSVFWRLGEVKVGGIIKVSRQDGTTARFAVTEVKQYEQDNFPTEKVYGNTKTPELRLITCGGTFNQLTQRYTKNTVVYGKLVN